MIESQGKTLMAVEKNLERKADVRLVLDKVSRSEYTSQIKKLQQADDHIAARSSPPVPTPTPAHAHAAHARTHAHTHRAVAREEYKSQLSALRDSISEDQKQRHQNIARIANELQKLVSDVSSKASKSDLIDVASVLNSFPKVHEEIDNLKVHHPPREPCRRVATSHALFHSFFCFLSGTHLYCDDWRACLF